MTVCDYCGENASGVDIWHCKYCDRHFCTKHRLPESHKCIGKPKNPHWGHGFHPNREISPHKNVERIYPFSYQSNGVIEKDSRRKKYRPFRGGSKIHYSIELKHILFILAFIALLVFINLNLDTIMDHLRPEEIIKEEIEQPTPEEETTRVPSKMLLIPIEEPSCQEIYSNPDKNTLIRSLCNNLCESKSGEFVDQSKCMGDKKLYCKCQLYQEVTILKDTITTEETVQEEPQETPKIEPEPKKTDDTTEDIVSFFTGPKIDDVWVHNFMNIVNNERETKGLYPMQELDQLNTIANLRFTKMMENPFISHYGAEAYNVGEVIFYPEGFTEQTYTKDIQANAPLHWDLLMDPMFSSYGYHTEEGPTIGIIGFCSVTEIPGPFIDEREFFSQHGCQTTTGNSIWLVIDMA